MLPRLKNIFVNVPRKINSSAIGLKTTAENYISGWVMYLLWVIGFVVANIIVTKISTRWSIQRMREKRAKEEKNNDKSN